MRQEQETMATQKAAAMPMTRRQAGAALISASAMLAAGMPSARAADPVSLKFWVAWDPALPDSKIAQAKIAQYEAAHPGVTIELQNMSFEAMHDKLVTAIAGGQGPDVSWGLAEWLGEFDRMGALADLTDAVAGWPDKAAIYPNVWTGLTVRGRIKAVPHYLGIRALLSHQALLAKAGIAAPPKSWAELLDQAAAIHTKTGKYAFAVANDAVRAPQEFFMLLVQNDAPLAEPVAAGLYRNNWDRDPAQLRRGSEVMALYRDLLARGAIAPSSTSWGWEEEDNNFALGQYAMVMNGSWMHLHEAQYPDSMRDVEITPPPGLRNRRTYFEINPFYVYKASAHLQQATDFAHFLITRDYQAAARPADSPRTDVVGTGKWGTSFSALAATGVPFPPVALGQITRDMQDAIGRVLLRHEEPQAVAARFGRAVNHALRQSGELASG